MTEPGLIALFVAPLNRAGIPYVVTGGVASVIYGEPRLTRDIDLVLALDVRDAERFAALWPADTFYVPPLEVIIEEARRAAHGHFKVIHHESTLRADVYLPGDDPLNRRAFAKAVPRRVDDVVVMLAPVEAVILNKLRCYTQGGSQRHLRDIRQMLEVSGALVDEAFLRDQTLALGLVDAMARARRFDPDA